MRILLVEDERTLNKQICKALQDDGYAVDVAYDGEEGQFLGETEPYDAVLLDLGLPVKNGLEVLKAWREAELSVPVLILTARDGWHEKVKGIDAGADELCDQALSYGRNFSAAQSTDTPQRRPCEQ